MHRPQQTLGTLLFSFASLAPLALANPAPPGPDAGPSRTQPAPALFAAADPAASRDAAGDDSAKALKSALSEASSARRSAQKLEGAPREEALAGAAAQYRQIMDTDTFSPAGRAEAAFRAGDIFRGLKRPADADELFHRAIELGQEAPDGREFAGRALLELAHIKRRANDVAGALALYAEVGSKFADQRRAAATAATWTGKLLLKSGEREQAAAVLLGFAEAWPEYPAEAVRNADLVAVDQAEAGDEAGATETVTRIRSAMEPVIAKGGRDAEAAQKAIESMRVTDMIASY